LSYRTAKAMPKAVDHCTHAPAGYPNAMRKTLLTVVLLAVATLAGCSASDVITIAASGDPEAAISALARSRAESYKRNPLRLVADARRAQAQIDRLLRLLRGEVGEVWGDGEIVTPGRKRYVKYTSNYKSRAIVEFDTGRVTVETVDQENPHASLHNAIVTTLLTPEDPRSVDIYSDRPVALSGRPYLEGLILDQHGRPITNPARAEAYARHLTGKATQTRTVVTGKGRQRVRYVRLTMVNRFENRQAERYAPLVDKYARRYGVSKSLVLAVIKTESSFNPFAVSSAPAFGLMQLVPTSGGRDAYRKVNGVDGIPSPDYLFDPERNIELGTAYLSIIMTRYLGGIADPVAREYCTISAYNGGAGNVLTTFSRDRRRAVKLINGLSTAEVYRRLRHEHPRAESRRYLTKVLEARRAFVSL